jgi:hypothetical protein
MIGISWVGEKLLASEKSLSSTELITVLSTPFSSTLSGCAIAQLASLWLPTATARVRWQVMSYGACGEPSGTGAGFLRVFQHPFPIVIPQPTP